MSDQKIQETDEVFKAPPVEKSVSGIEENTFDFLGSY